MMSKSTGYAMAALALVWSVPLRAQEPRQIEPRETLLMISAQGEAEAAPDSMSVGAGVTTTGATAAEAIDANNRLMRSLFDALANLGIADSAIETVNFSVEPVLNDRSRDATDVRILGYQAENFVSVTFTDLASVEEIISALFDAGANQVDGPRFSLSDEQALDRLQEQALRKAVANARREAGIYADALGMRVARVVRVSDRSIGESRYAETDRIVVTGSRVQPTPIAPSPVSLDAAVYVEFALVPSE